jgi:hypothetical protein
VASAMPCDTILQLAAHGLTERQRSLTVVHSECQCPRG